MLNTEKNIVKIKSRCFIFTFLYNYMQRLIVKTTRVIFYSCKLIDAKFIFHIQANRCITLEQGLWCLLRKGDAIEWLSWLTVAWLHIYPLMQADIIVKVRSTRLISIPQYIYSPITWILCSRYERTQEIL